MTKLYLALLLAAPALAQALPVYVPDPNEQAVLRALLDDEYASFLAGGSSLIGARMKLPAAPADAVAQAYAQGPSERFPATLSRPLLLTGQARAAKDGWFNFNTTSGASVRAEAPAGMKAATSTALICDQMDYAQGRVSFTLCRDAAPVAKTEVAALRSDLLGFYQGHATQAEVSQLAINIAVSARLLPANHGCPQDRTRCAAALADSYTADQRDEVLKAVLQSMQQAGLDLRPYLKQPNPNSGR